MSSPAASHGWAGGRWVTILAVVLAGQVAIIFWLAGHGAPPTPTAATAPPRVYFPTESASAAMGAIDPTIFVRPNQRGFSGPAWMQAQPKPHEQPQWTDSSPPSNDLPVEQLGGSLSQFLQTNFAPAVELSPKPEPEPPIVVTDDPLANPASTLTIEGDLAKRPLLHPIKLAEWPATETTEILSNSVVQTGVDQDGNVFSATLLTGSGSKDADASALKLARTARFEPLQRFGGVTKVVRNWGQLIFNWHTVEAAPVTNNNPSLNP